MKIILPIVLLFLFTTTKAQILKGSWMAGGSAAFTSTTLPSADQKTMSVKLSGNAGYFLVNKLAIGLSPEFEFTSFRERDNPRQQGTVAAVGPFIRYYVLQAAAKTNIFIESTYAFGVQKIGSIDRYTTGTLAFSTGSAVFLTPSVALQFIVGYQVRKTERNLYPTMRNINAGIGFQIHF
ncbi:MAG: hypothetical protein J0H92_07075 [Sphingobacteriales bacterium]|jgi:hypothetical protein|nr:hypothetical protein [Sphingobacteriales bacterium]OJW36968.1 MAG: hypothetical protein BGO54_12780 [Sphingobacteriales bacterium 46-32]